MKDLPQTESNLFQHEKTAFISHFLLTLLHRNVSVCR